MGQEGVGMREIVMLQVRKEERDRMKREAGEREDWKEERGKERKEGREKKVQ